MTGGAQLSKDDLRRTARHPVDCRVIAEHLRHGGVTLDICNISPCGFMIDNATDLSRGDRMLLALPEMGRIEAYCIWIVDRRAGFQFERIIRPEQFSSLIGRMQPNPALRLRC